MVLIMLLAFQTATYLVNNSMLVFFLVDCKWENWSAWSTCTKTCGGGITTRSRVEAQEALYGGADCFGDDTEDKPCNQEINCPGTNRVLTHFIMYVVL